MRIGAHLYQLFCAGQKDQLIDINTIKIDETLLKDYSASGSIEQVLAGTDKLLQMKIAYGEDTPPLIKKCVHEIQINSLLKNKTDEGQDGSVIRTTPAGTYFSITGSVNITTRAKSKKPPSRSAHGINRRMRPTVHINRSASFLPEAIRFTDMSLKQSAMRYIRRDLVPTDGR